MHDVSEVGPVPVFRYRFLHEFLFYISGDCLYRSLISDVNVMPLETTQASYVLISYDQ
jgi:hypothetical protein